MRRILIIEDEENIRKIIAYDLKKANYEIVEASDGKEALQLACEQNFDVLIIDWMLPYVSGIDIVKTLRAKRHDEVFIMLTARDDEADLLYAFEQGVDDYVCKPFSPRELVARVNAHMKRRGVRDEQILVYEDVALDVKRRSVKIHDEDLDLTKKEFDLLEYFLNNREVVLSRDAILNEIWGFDYDGDTRIVDVHVFKLRSKLSKSKLHIKSMRGVGYALEVNPHE